MPVSKIIQIITFFFDYNWAFSQHEKKKIACFLSFLPFLGKNHESNVSFEKNIKQNEKKKKVINSRNRDFMDVVFSFSFFIPLPPLFNIYSLSDFHHWTVGLNNVNFTSLPPSYLNHPSIHDQQNVCVCGGGGKLARRGNWGTDVRLLWEGV